MKTFKIITIVLVAVGISGCKSLQTQLAITEPALPQVFEPLQTDSATVADINWRAFFEDEKLLALIDTALQNHFDLHIALQRIETARLQAGLAKNQLLPAVDAHLSVGSTRYGHYTEDYAGNSETELNGAMLPNPIQDYFIGFTTSWEIDIWGKLRNSRKAAVANYLASIEGKNFVRSNLVADIATLYYELVALDNELETLQQTIQKQQETFEVVQVYKNVGRTNKLAVQQFHAQLLNTQALEKETLQQITATENMINFLLGRFPQKIERNKDVLFRTLPKQIKTGIPPQLLANRPDIREAEFQVQASKLDVKAARAAFFPNINIGATLGFQALQPKFLFSTPASLAYTAAGGLLAPVLNLKALKTQFGTAKSNQLMAMYHYQKTIVNGYMEVANELSALENLQQANALKSEQDEVLRNSIEAATAFFRLAKGSYLDVLVAQQNALQTRLELIEVNKQQRIATVNVYKALGGGWQ